VRRAGFPLPSWCPGVLLALVQACAPPADAQERAVCGEGRVVEIVIENNSVFALSDPERGGRFAWAYELANRLHLRTRAEVIQRELLFDVGDCYDIEQLRDSERLLRGFAFLADAHIFGVRLPDGDVQVVVDTHDEWSMRIEPRIGSGGVAGLRGLRLVEDNLAGTGRHLSLFYDREEEDRVYGLGYATPHLLRSRWNMALRLAQTDAGGSYHGSVSYPFLGEAGRFAARQALDRHDRQFEMLVPTPHGDLDRHLIPVRREQFELGAAVRWGAARYRHTLFGASLAGERVSYPEAPRFVGPVSASLPADTAIAGQWHPFSSVRLMFLGGRRNVFFVRRHALETVNGTEDVQLGTEVEVVLGPALPRVSADRDLAIGFGFSAASEPAEGVILGARFAFDGRRSHRDTPHPPAWYDLQSELDLRAYLRRDPGSRHLVVAALSALGGWHPATPFQLTLGGDSGLRGYPRHVDPGGRRLVTSLEQRSRWNWPAPELFDFGTAAFLDVGKIWPGDGPFGTESPLRASVGAGIRAAFPPGSRQTFRIDVGVPVARDAGFRHVIFAVGVGQTVDRRVTRRDPQLLRSARYTLSTSRFVQAVPHR
jgi:hypothetical protein